MNGGPHADSRNCTWQLFPQVLDHFSAGVLQESTPTTWNQRVCVYDKYWGGPGDPIFFYTGNESPVEEYINNTGTKCLIMNPGSMGSPA